MNKGIIMNYKEFKKEYKKYTQELKNAIKSEDINELVKVLEKYKNILGEEFIERFKNTNEEVKKLTLYKIMLALNLSNEYNLKAKDYILTYRLNHRIGKA